MDLNRIVVLFWLVLPILGYIIYRFFPLGLSTTTGQITDTSMVLKTNRDGSRTYDSNVTYTFQVKGIDYTATASPIYWGEFKRGDAIKIHYNPKLPKYSQIWRPGKAGGWIVISLIWLSLVLGVAGFIVNIGLLCIYGVYTFIMVTKKHFQIITPRLVFFWVVFGLFIIFFAFLIIEAGVEVFQSCGLIGQNWLWAMWNHRPLCS